MRILSHGAEAGSIALAEVITLGSPTVSAAVKRTGNYSFYCSGRTVGLGWGLGGDYTELYLRVAVQIADWYDNDANQVLVSLQTAAGSSVACLHLDTGHRLRARIYDGSWTTLATGGTVLQLDTMYCIEAHIKVHGTEGIFDVKLDGASEIEYAGDTLGTNPSIGRIILNYTSSLNGCQGAYYDDIAVNDTTGDRNNTWCGRGGLWPVYVTGPGDLSQFTPSAGANHECVDDVPPDDDTSYVSSDTEGHRDSYTITVPEVSGGVTAFTLWHKAKLNEAGAGNLTQFLRKASVNYDGDLKGLDTTYRYVSHTWETNPATGQPWTLADLEEFYVGQETS